jgi:multiple sugar transport system ATP-binding protein
LNNIPDAAKGRDVTIGIRPEHFRLDEHGIRAEIITVEPTGSETQVALRFAGHEVVGAFRERIDARPGEFLSLTPDYEKIHLFDGVTGVRLND